MKLTVRQIERLVKQGEVVHTECKDASGGLPDSLWESYSAFANTDGGVILLGAKEVGGKFSIADYHGRRGIVIEKQAQTISFSNPGVFRVNKAVAVEGGTSDARNSHIFNIFALVDIGERSGMGLSSLYGTWEKEHFAAPSIVESYEPDRTKVLVEFEADDSELGEMIGKVPEGIGKTSEVGVIGPELGEKTSEVGEKKAVSEGENAEVKEKTGVSDDVKTGLVSM